MIYIIIALTDTTLGASAIGVSPLNMRYDDVFSLLDEQHLMYFIQQDINQVLSDCFIKFVIEFAAIASLLHTISSPLPVTGSQVITM
jgi:hypothetical protein